MWRYELQHHFGSFWQVRLAGISQVRTLKCRTQHCFRQTWNAHIPRRLVRLPEVCWNSAIFLNLKNRIVSKRCRQKNMLFTYVHIISFHVQLVPAPDTSLTQRQKWTLELPNESRSSCATAKMISSWCKRQLLCWKPPGHKSTWINKSIQEYIQAHISDISLACPIQIRPNPFHTFQIQFHIKVHKNGAKMKRFFHGKKKHVCFYLRHRHTFEHLCFRHISTSQPRSVSSGALIAVEVLFTTSQPEDPRPWGKPWGKTRHFTMGFSPWDLRSKATAASRRSPRRCPPNRKSVSQRPGVSFRSASAAKWKHHTFFISFITQMNLNNKQKNEPKAKNVCFRHTWNDKSDRKWAYFLIPACEKSVKTSEWTNFTVSFVSMSHILIGMFPTLFKKKSLNLNHSCHSCFCHPKNDIFREFILFLSWNVWSFWSFWAFKGALQYATPGSSLVTGRLRNRGLTPIEAYRGIAFIGKKHM